MKLTRLAVLAVLLLLVGNARGQANAPTAQTTLTGQTVALSWIQPGNTYVVQPLYNVYRCTGGVLACPIPAMFSASNTGPYGSIATGVAGGCSATTPCYVDITVAPGMLYTYLITAVCSPAPGSGCGTTVMPVNGESAPSGGLTVAIPTISITVSRTVSGQNATITATYTDSTMGVTTTYQLWADPSTKRLLTSGKNTNNPGTPYTITWSGAKMGNDMPILTVTDSAGAAVSSLP